MPSARVVEAGQVGEVLAAVRLESSGRFSPSSSSSVSRQSAEKPGATTARRLTPVLRPAPSRSRRCRGCSHSSLPKRDWKLEAEAFLRPAEGLAQEAPGLDAVAVVGVALEKVGSFGTPWNETRITSGSKSRRARSRFIDRYDRVDVDRIVVIGRRDPDRRLPAHRPSAPGKRGRRPSPRSPPNIADRAARGGCGRSPLGAAPGCGRRWRDCRSASPSRPSRVRPRSRSDAARGFSACALVIVFSGPSSRSLFQILA